MLTGRGRFPISVRGASRSPSLGQALRVLRSRSALARFARYRDFQKFLKGRKKRFKKGVGKGVLKRGPGKAFQKGGRERRFKKGVGKGVA